MSAPIEPVDLEEFLKTASTEEYKAFIEDALANGTIDANTYSGRSALIKAVENGSISPILQ